MGSAVYKIQAKADGEWKGSIPQARVAGAYTNPKAVYVKVSGVWRLSYEKISWTYSWHTGAWSQCGAIGTYQTRPVWCERAPDAVTVDENYCSDTKPLASQICNCNCACACCCD